MKIVVVGAGGHAKVIVDSIERSGTWELVGLLDAHLPVGTQILGHNVLGSDQLLPQLFAEGMVTGVVIAVGDNFLRAKIAAALRKLAPAIAFPAIIHPAASIARSAKIGAGTVVMAGAVVNSSATVGEFCILNTNCSLDHDCTLGNYASLAPNACVGGSATIGESTAISLGANVIHRVTIGAHTVVGAGATVLKDLPDHSVAYGTPARVIRARLEGEKYL
jgi:sugar O-acyltransferase (sialic acid O-acetyltransferase NeuD family)